MSSNDHLQLVRFRFYGAGHGNPITGHLYLRWVKEQNIWRLTEWQRKNGARKDTEGSEPAEGAHAFTKTLQEFANEWAKLQQAAIDEQSQYLSRLKPESLLAKPGFRPVSAAKVWSGYCRETTKEIDAIKADVSWSVERLYNGGWLDYPNVVFPSFTFKNPWT